MPEDATEIGPQAFAGSDAFERVILPEGIGTIGGRAFADCAGLVYINFPENLDDIAEDAFDGCGTIFAECSEDSAGEEYAEEHGMIIVGNE